MAPADPASPSAQNARPDIAWVTPALAVGHTVGVAGARALAEAGVTHMLSLEHQSPVYPDSLFRGTAWQPLPDFANLPLDEVWQALTLVHEVVCLPDARLYVHCFAGINRAPNVVFLYLVACGWPRAEAAQAVLEARPSAIPDDPMLVTDELYVAVATRGVLEFQPHPRPAAIAPQPSDGDA